MILGCTIDKTYQKFSAILSGQRKGVHGGGMERDRKNEIGTCRERGGQGKTRMRRKNEEEGEEGRISGQGEGALGFCILSVLPSRSIIWQLKVDLS